MLSSWKLTVLKVLDAVKNVGALLLLPSPVS